jgi:hypothetical protein
VIRLLGGLALLAGCSGGQADVDNDADARLQRDLATTSEPLASAAPVVSAPTAVASIEPTATSSARGPLDKLGKICTQIGCRDQLVLQAPNVKLAAGTYLLTVDADGKKSSCPLEVDAKDMKTNGCIGDAGVSLALPGSVPVRGAEGGFSLVFGSAPANVKVTVTSAAKKKLLDQAFTPTYKTVQPNGPDCSPTCRQAQETLPLK